MNVFIRLLILFAIAACVAIGARFNPGNVVFFYPPYRVDISLNLFLLLAFVFFIAFYYGLRAVAATRDMPGKVAAYRRSKRERDGNKALREALKALYEGRFGFAERAAVRAAELDENEGVASLIGARAAHHMGQADRRDDWLSRIENQSAYNTARLVSATELLVEEHKAERALDAIKELNASGIRHIQVLRWTLKAQQQAKNWPEVLKLVRALDKHRALHPALSKRLRELAYEHLLKQPGHDPESLLRVWYDIPAHDRKQAFVASTAATSFCILGLHAEARVAIEKALEHEWDSRLVRAYRVAAATEGSQALRTQIESCEQWSQKNPADAELSLTLGVLCFRQKLWGKAQRHLEDALSNALESFIVREANLNLANLHEALGQTEQAAFHYRQCAIATTLS